MADNYDGQYQDITMQAIISTSTAKMGNGTHNLVDGSVLPKIYNINSWIHTGNLISVHRNKHRM